MDRRHFLATSFGLLAEAPDISATRPKKIAAATTVYTLNSHAEVIAGRLLETHSLNGKGRKPRMELVSLYADQVPANDMSRAMARKHGLLLARTVADALTLGTRDLAVDGVLLIGEHGQYPLNSRGQVLYPRRRFFEETVKVFRRSGRVVPVFTDKHLSATWEDAKWMYDTAREMKIPLMAGSSVPLTWRHPPRTTTLGCGIDEIFAISFHLPEIYGFHALELLQCLAERRQGGETGVAAVRCLEGPRVWQLLQSDRKKLRLFRAAAACSEQKGAHPASLQEWGKEPILFIIEYRDGLVGSVLTQQHLGEWCVAWQEKGVSEPAATLAWTQEARPVGHFEFLVNGIEQMMLTGKPTWPVERTLLTTGVLDALMISKSKNGLRLATPYLDVAYQPTFSWSPPPPPPPSRPFTEF